MHRLPAVIATDHQALHAALAADADAEAACERIAQDAQQQLNALLTARGVTFTGWLPTSTPIGAAERMQLRLQTLAHIRAAAPLLGWLSIDEAQQHPAWPLLRATNCYGAERTQLDAQRPIWTATLTAAVADYRLQDPQTLACQLLAERLISGLHLDLVTAHPLAVSCQTDHRSHRRGHRGSGYESWLPHQLLGDLADVARLAGQTDLLPSSALPAEAPIRHTAEPEAIAIGDHLRLIVRPRSLTWYLGIPLAACLQEHVGIYRRDPVLATLSISH